MDGGKDIFLDEVFAEEDGVFVVCSLPKAYRQQWRCGQGKLAVICCRSISKDLTFFDLIALKDNGALVDTGTLVGTFEFQDIVFIDAFSIITSDEDLSPLTYLTVPACLARMQTPESTAILYSIPVPTTGAFGLSRGVQPDAACSHP